ncbi:hypothetical protein QFZ43_000240 [Streptomyces afghaniensis]|nr:hypothetical protein [Streptomyces afghaniensis]
MASFGGFLWVTWRSRRAGTRTSARGIASAEVTEAGPRRKAGRGTTGANHIRATEAATHALLNTNQ